MNTEIERIKAKFNITPEDTGLVRQAGVLLQDHIPVFIDRWYDWLRAREEFSQFFGNNPTNLKRVQSLQLGNWKTFFEADINEEYVVGRRHVGAVHARIDLPNEIYFAGMGVSLDLLTDALRRIEPAPARLDDMVKAVSKRIFLDTYLAVDEISRIQKQRLADSAQALLELSTPVTPIWEGILLLPLLGIIDSVRTQDIMNKTLAKIAETSAKVFVLDISGVAAIDTGVANQMIKITKATRLMGCEAIISGISPSIARTLVERRSRAPIASTADLAAAVMAAYGPRARQSRMHPATRTFMALRILVNDELRALDHLLAAIERGSRAVTQGAHTWLRPGARSAIIAFHSLEDRRVKHAFADWERAGLGTRLTRKPVEADESEIRANPRARSAKLRAFQIAAESVAAR